MIDPSALRLILLVRTNWLQRWEPETLLPR
jgi:hypothetical protein